MDTVHYIGSDIFQFIQTNTRRITDRLCGRWRFLGDDKRLMHPAFFASKTLFFVRRTREHRRGWYSRVRVTGIHILMTNGVHPSRHHVAPSIRIKRRCICELHSCRESRVVVDMALMEADKDHDERRIGTLRKQNKNKNASVSQGTLVFSPTRRLTETNNNTESITMKPGSGNTRNAETRYRICDKQVASQS